MYRGEGGTSTLPLVPRLDGVAGAGGGAMAPHPTKTTKHAIARMRRLLSFYPQSATIAGRRSFNPHIRRLTHRRHRW